MQDQLQVVPATTKEVFANHSYDAMWATEEVNLAVVLKSITRI